MDLDLWKTTTIIAGIVLTITLFNNPAITGAFISSRPVLELFVMSQCPYGVAAEQLMAPVLNAFQDSIDFRLHYIAAYSNNKLRSMHGAEEVNEDIRQLCAKKYYPNNYFNYVLCYNDLFAQCNADYSTCSSSGGSDCSAAYSACVAGIDWEYCAAQLGFNVGTISNCYQSDEGKQLLINDIKRAGELGIQGSETFVLDGLELSRTYRWSPDKLKQLICDKHPGLSACSLTLGSGASGSVSGSC